jgi:hypothetical protein
MSDTDKLFAIYTWLVMNVNYDYLAYHKAENNTITATQSREYDSWFADGVFNNGKAVCEGYAKALLIMARIENIPCIYVTGNNHAWNKVFIDGNWYGIDATHGDMADKENNYEILSYTEFLFTDSYKESAGYTTSDHEELAATTMFNFYDYFTISGGADFKIDNTSELKALASYIASLPKLTNKNCITFECLLSSNITVNASVSVFSIIGVVIALTTATTNPQMLPTTNNIKQSFNILDSELLSFKFLIFSIIISPLFHIHSSVYDIRNKSNES